MWSFHVVVLQRTAKKCTKVYLTNMQSDFSCSLNLFFAALSLLKLPNYPRSPEPFPDVQNTCTVMHLSMLSPRGGTPGICGAFDLFCLPHPREFDLESGPQGGDVCFFFARRTGS